MDQEMRDLIIRIDARTESMADKFEVIDKRLDSHASDLKELGRWRFYLMGLGTAVSAYLKLSR